MRRAHHGGILRKSQRRSGHNVHGAAAANRFRALTGVPLPPSGIPENTMGATSKVIAILEDNPARAAAMKSALHRRFPDAEAIFFDNAPDMVAWLPGNLPTVCLLSLDHNLG